MTDEIYAVMHAGAAALTPLGNPLRLPGAALGRAVEAEWREQGKKPDRRRMRLTAIAAIALDLADARAQALKADLAAYAATDLLSYRSPEPELRARQEAAFAPVIRWAGEQLGVTFPVTDGVMPVPQPDAVKLGQVLDRFDSWRLGVLAAIVRPLGSLTLGLAFLAGVLDAEAAFHASTLEERFTAERWGKDEEQEAVLAALHAELAAASLFLQLLGAHAKPVIPLGS